MNGLNEKAASSWSRFERPLANKAVQPGEDAEEDAPRAEVGFEVFEIGVRQLPFAGRGCIVQRQQTQKPA